MGVQTPCYVVDEKRLRENLTILRQVAQEAGCKILLAQKAFSMFAVYPLIGEYLAGSIFILCASKTAMRWWRRYRRWKRNSAPSSIR